LATLKIIEFGKSRIDNYHLNETNKMKALESKFQDNILKMNAKTISANPAIIRLLKKHIEEQLKSPSNDEKDPNDEVQINSAVAIRSRKQQIQ
jgi:hypothetical protein